jgi:hypothetical protein
MNIRNKILTKKDYYELAPSLGNQPRTFGVLGKENLDSIPDIPLALRSIKKIGGQFIHLRKSELKNYYHLKGVVEINETYPPEKVIAHGECCLNPDWYLIYSTEKAYYREALRNSPRILKGYQARLWLEDTLGSYFEQITTLFEIYPDSTIEWAFFSVPVGVEKSRFILWEVRDY